MTRKQEQDEPFITEDSTLAGILITKKHKVIRQPDARQRVHYCIQERDGYRLKYSVKRIFPYRKIYSFLSSLFFNVAITGFFTLIAFRSAEKLAAWVIPTTWCILISSLILGFVLLFLDNQQKEIIRFSVTQVEDEMDAIEKYFDKANEAFDNDLDVLKDLSPER